MKPLKRGGAAMWPHPAALVLALAVLPLLAPWPGKADTFEKTAAPISVDLRSAALLISDQQGGSLPMAAAAFRRGQGEDGVMELEVTVEVDGQALLEALATEEHVAGEPPAAAGPSVAAPPETEIADPSQVVELHVYVLSPRLEVVTARSLAIPILRGDASVLTGTGLRIRLQLEVPPGTYRLRTLTRAGEAFGLRQLALEAPAPKTPTILEPRLAQEASWLEARAAGEASPADHPAVRPVVLPGEELRFPAAFFGPPAPAIRASFEPLGSRSPADEGAEVTVGTVASAHRLTVPEIPPGIYRLSLHGEGYAPSLPITLGVLRPQDVSSAEDRDTGARGDAVDAAWPALSRLRTSVEEPAPAPLELPERTGRQLRLLRAEYAKTLGVLARRGLREGTRALADFQAATVQSLGPRATTLLRDLEARLAGSIVRRTRRPGTLLPVVLAHQGTAALHLADGHSRLAQHARDAELALVRFYSAAAGESLPREAAAGLILSAHELQKRGRLDTSGELFRQALELEPEEAGALLGLGTRAAWLGELEEAAGHLAGYLELMPGDEEAELRLAVVEQRRGSSDASALRVAERRLEKLTRSGTPWIACLASQQWIRAALDRESWESASARLRTGRERCPEEPALAFAAAFLHERRDATTEARAALPGARGFAASTRTRFNVWPDAPFAERRQWLEQRAEERLPQLLEWVEGAAERRRGRRKPERGPRRRPRGSGTP